MRSLPRIVSGIPSDLRNFLDRVREYLGEGGDNRFVTLKELKAGGIVGTTPGGTITVPPPPGAVQDPTPPTGLAASGALANIILTWNTPNYLGHDYTEVWAATTNNFDAKTLVGTAPGVTFTHNIGSGGSRYYWVRFVNTLGTTGPFNDTVGTLGTTGTDPAYVLDVLAGSITEAELYSTLNNRLDLIDGSPATPGTIPYQLALLQGQIDDLNATPVYDNTVTYAAGDIVQYNGGLYQALRTTLDDTPSTSPDDWLKIGDYTSLGDAVATHTTQITNLTTDLGAEVTAREALATQMRGTYAGTDITLVTSGLIYSERQARATADSSEVGAREALAAQVRGSYDGTDLELVTSGLIYSERVARAGADSALASDITTLSTTVGNNTAAIETNASSIDGVKALYTVKIDNNGFVSGYGLISDFTDGGAPVSKFYMNVDQFAVTTPTSSIPEWASNTSYAVGRFVRITGDNTKMLVCKVAGTSGGSAPSIAGAIGSLVVDGTTTPVTWQIASRVPLSVLTSSQTINGVTVPPGVYIDGASIVNATINNAQIANLAVDSAKIANVSADKITAGSIQTGYIRSTSYIPATSPGGPQGWSINADGTAEFANGIFRGNIYGSGATSYGVGEGLFSGRDYVPVSTLTRSSTTATLTTSQAHGLAVGSVIVLTGSTNGWDNTYTVTAVISTTQVQFTVANTLATPATGTMVIYTPYRFRVGSPSGSQLVWNGSSLLVSGTLLGGNATSYTSGTGLFAGFDGTTYKFRVGNPAGSYIRWTGSALEVAGPVISTTNIKQEEVNSLDSATNAAPIDFADGNSSYTIGYVVATVSGIVVPDLASGVVVSYSLFLFNDAANSKTFRMQIVRGTTVIDQADVRVKAGVDQIITRFTVDKPTTGTYNYSVVIRPNTTTTPGNLVLPTGAGTVMVNVQKR